MIVYWVVFATTALLAVAPLKVSRIGWGIIAIALVGFVGLRYQVGGDWGTYLIYLARISEAPFSRIFELKDPGYQFVNWVAGAFGFQIWFVNVAAAAVFIGGLIQFMRTLPDPRMALAVSIPYMVIVMGMGYTRQAMAFGFVLWGLNFLVQRRLLGFVFFLAVGATFHKSAVIFVPLAVLADAKNRVWTTVWVGTTGLLLFILLLQEHVDTLYQNYVVSDYSSASEGGPIRAMMNALPAGIFILLRKRFAMSSQERALWFWVAVLCFACLPLLAVSATAVDRVALYLMPIQLVVASYLPQFFLGKDRVISRVCVLGFYAAVMFVWLNYAGHRDAWLPYQFWPMA